MILDTVLLFDMKLSRIPTIGATKYQALTAKCAASLTLIINIESCSLACHCAHHNKDHIEYKYQDHRSGRYHSELVPHHLKYMLPLQAL